MISRIEQDHSRFREIIRGKIRQNLRKYISRGDLIAPKGQGSVTIPMPQIDIPHFRFGGKQQGGVGQGTGDPGDSLGQGQEQPGAGKAGDTANLGGTGALGQAAPGEIGGVERSDVPEEYREQVGRYFQPK